MGYEELIESLMMLGAYDIEDQVEKVVKAEPKTEKKKKPRPL